MNKLFEQVNELIFKHANVTKSLNLESGKLGLCIYFFEMSKIKNSIKYRKQAISLFDQVCKDLKNYSAINSIFDITQMGIAIDFLVNNNYIQGNINSLLRDFDDIIFMKMISGNPTQIEMIIVLYYLYRRIEKQNKGSDDCFMLEELCMLIFNNLYKTVELDFFEEPSFFTIEYKVPMLIYVLSKLYALNFYNKRLSEVVKEISNLITSKIPTLHSNRLYLLWSLIQLKQVTNFDIWNEQIEILYNHIDPQKIILKELKNKNIFIKDGVAGIFLLLKEIKLPASNISIDRALIMQKIINSELWKNEKWIVSGLGLINGVSGSILIYSLLESK